MNLRSCCHSQEADPCTLTTQHGVPLLTVTVCWQIKQVTVLFSLNSALTLMCWILMSCLWCIRNSVGIVSRWTVLWCMRNSVGTVSRWTVLWCVQNSVGIVSRWTIFENLGTLNFIFFFYCDKVAALRKLWSKWWRMFIMTGGRSIQDPVHPFIQLCMSLQWRWAPWE